MQSFISVLLMIANILLILMYNFVPNLTYNLTIDAHSLHLDIMLGISVIPEKCYTKPNKSNVFRDYILIPALGSVRIFLY